MYSNVVLVPHFCVLRVIYYNKWLIPQIVKWENESLLWINMILNMVSINFSNGGKICGFELRNKNLLGTKKRANGGDGDGFLEGVDMNVGEVGCGLPRNRLISIVNKNFNETQWENSFKCLSNTSWIRTINSYSKHLCFLFSSYLVSKSRQSPCKTKKIQKDPNWSLNSLLFFKKNKTIIKWTE